MTLGKFTDEDKKKLYKFLKSKGYLSKEDVEKYDAEYGLKEKSAAFRRGFMDKMAEFQKFAGPRPEERDAIKRLTQNIVNDPAKMKNFVVDGLAPPRSTDPVWNSGNVQKWVTGLSSAPAAAYYAPAAARAVGRLATKPLWYEEGYGGLHGGGDYFADPVSILDTPVGMAGVLGSPFAAVAGIATKAEQMKKDRQLSKLQRQRDAAAILAGQQPEEEPMWTADTAALFKELPKSDKTPAPLQTPPVVPERIDQLVPGTGGKTGYPARYISVKNPAYRK